MFVFLYTLSTLYKCAGHEKPKSKAETGGKVYTLLAFALFIVSVKQSNLQNWYPTESNAVLPVTVYLTMIRSPEKKENALL